MAIFNKSSIENRLDIDNVTDMVTVEKETMSIVWPDAKTVAMTALEFILQLLQDFVAGELVTLQHRLSQKFYKSSDNKM